MIDVMLDASGESEWEVRINGIGLKGTPDNCRDVFDALNTIKYDLEWYEKKSQKNSEHCQKNY
jgi:hypothetical protein